MVYTENPYVDIIIYYVKKLGLDTVLKMNDNALDKETLESKKAADLLIECVESTAPLARLTGVIDEDLLREAGITNSATITAALANWEYIPKEFRPKAVELARNKYIASYEEHNDYYRMLNGLPPMGYENVYTDWVPPDGIVFDNTIPVHEQSDGMIQILIKYGVIDEMLDDPDEAPYRDYLRYLTKRIDPYTARRAPAFGILYVPKIDKTEIYNEYRERLSNNGAYVLQTVYSDAYKYESDYYDNFIAILIILDTMIDLISRTNEFITRREVFDIRTVRYLFESYGIDFFPEIPLKYQLRMIKNLHTLLKYKSTPRCMVDICSLFGFDNITIFKYYLLKNRKLDKSDLSYSFTGNDEEDFDLKFVKIPIGEPMNDYIRDRKYQYSYDAITEGDPKWDGGLDHTVVKKQHLAADYNYTRTKYISIDSMYDIARMSLQQAYFMNMLYDNLPYETELSLSIPYIGSEKFNIADIFTFLTCLTFHILGIKDTMMDTSTKVLNVLGFNFHADLDEMREVIKQMGYKLDAMESFEDFIEPTESIPNINMLMNIYKNNIAIRDALAKGMREADNLRVYNTYKYIYDSLMVEELTMDFFKNPETGDYYRDEDGDATYVEYLKHKSPTLYYKMMEIDEIEEEDVKNDYITNLIDNTCYILDQYIDTDEFRGLFRNLPAVSTEAIKAHIKTVIDFYMSYKVYFLGMNTIYYFDDDLEGWIKIIDWVQLNRWFEKDEFAQPIDVIAEQFNDIFHKDKYPFRERIYLDRWRWEYRAYYEYDTRLKDRKIITSKLHLGDAVYERLDTDTSINKVYNSLDKVTLTDGPNEKLYRFTIGDPYRPKDYRLRDD